MRNEAILEETINGHMVEVFYDDINPLDVIDTTIFESDEDLQKYLNEFENGNLTMYCITVRKLCTCCNHKNEFIDSLGAIEAESAKDALDFYFTSGQAPEILET